MQHLIAVVPMQTSEPEGSFVSKHRCRGGHAPNRLGEDGGRFSQVADVEDQKILRTQEMTRGTKSAHSVGRSSGIAIATRLKKQFLTDPLTP